MIKLSIFPILKFNAFPSSSHSIGIIRQFSTTATNNNCLRKCLLSSYRPITQHYRNQLTNSSSILQNSSPFSSISYQLDSNANSKSTPPTNDKNLPVAKPATTTVVNTDPLVKKTFFQTRFGHFIKWSILTCGIFSGSILALIIGFFLYDYTTYVAPEIGDSVLVHQLALNPPRGGPENLPILIQNLDDLDTPEKEINSHKPKLVILGCGWGSVGLIDTLKPNDYDVTVISPTNYFLFTPMLPSAAVGTLELKSLIESVRNIIKRVNGHYLEAYAEDVLFSEKLVKVRVKCNDELSSDGNNSNDKFFYVPYDKLIVGIGSTSNTHGVAGLQYSNQLKTAEDAVLIRKKIIKNLEKACLPTTSNEERKKLLSFVICGAGPTGVEVAAEIYDLLHEDIIKGFPRILAQEVSIHIIQSRSNILNTYDKTISDYAMKRFENDQIDLLTNSRVKEILPDKVVFAQKSVNQETGVCDGKSVEIKEIPYGLCLWSTGVAQNPLAQKIVQNLSHSQNNKRAIETDSQLRVLGSPLGDVYAIGDCSTIRTDLALHCSDNIRQYIIGNHFNRKMTKHPILTDDDIQHVSLSHGELNELAIDIAKKNPLASEPLLLMNELIAKYDTQNTGYLNFNQIKLLLKEVDSKVISLPATAQRANQQGRYLGKKLTKLAKSSLTLSMNDIITGDIDNAISKPFKYTHLGSLAYIGNSAVFDLPGHSFVGGLVAMYLWRSIYFAQSVSIRTRVLLFMDWINRGIFGRDIITI
ncbi:unnamed protein product [[Candida] boidinii]|uniref:Unnamed protein product n=1 Tax=Candida boidinii TaxID=5477 RepID=A0A9W6WFJ5_CANBO|nr:hypothetical protein B5S30_g3316 [[Candida] boidinii]OWB85884.1 hypothetical protein B5S33_g4559 [[Candida] boidinii]GME67298.1 unnamed protein product [[Candida] boidinii]